MFTTSIRWRLQLWLGFLLVCVLTGFGVTVRELHRIQLLNQIDDELERRVASLSLAVRGAVPPDFGPGFPPPDGRPDAPGFGRGPDGPGPSRGRRGGPPPFDGPRGDNPGERQRRPPPWLNRMERMGPGEFKLPPEAAGLFADSGTNGFYFVAWIRDGNLLSQSTNAPAEVPRPERVTRDTRTHLRTRDSLREAFHYTELGECVLAGRSIAGDLLALHRFELWLMGAGGLVLALGLGGGWWMTTRAIRPIEEISMAASRISDGNLSERITGTDPGNELGRLAGVLNSTFARLESAFDRQRQFTADASHELRTPLTVLISEAQTALTRERSAGEYRETIEACLDTAQQMRHLTESLLELARCDAGRDGLERQLVDLAKAAGDVLERLGPLAVSSGLGIKSDLSSACILSGADRLGQVITNLISNAVHYNKPGGEICIVTRIEGASAVLSVADTGFGIAVEDLPHIFERFYRADKSRSRASGRFGLGLAICRAIVEADGGTIEVRSTPGVGSEFRVIFPARPA